VRGLRKEEVREKGRDRDHNAKIEPTMPQKHKPDQRRP